MCYGMFYLTRNSVYYNFDFPYNNIYKPRLLARVDQNGPDLLLLIGKWNNNIMCTKFEVYT